VIMHMPSLASKLHDHDPDLRPPLGPRVITSSLSEAKSMRDHAGA
jgi:hypothetical protein